MAIIRKSGQEIEQMERAGRVVVQTLELLGEHVRAGVTTQELDELAEEFIRSHGGVPTFKGYRGYPASICTSPNDMVVHGIPGPYTLKEGDVLSVDVGVTLDGFVGDSAYTFPVGEVDEDARRLLDTCQAAQSSRRSPATTSRTSATPSRP
jgi:methionyl aminopeptidase